MIWKCLKEQSVITAKLINKNLILESICFLLYKIIKITLIKNI